ncbi:MULTISPECIES: pyrroloquinoline quinone-dependent dehydrogenase [unclassified Devosia]|uniref:pyrroloquinoline quinone-dependent dehydrogenase n=1 Tax=unclassified Devosia TaxID=196773 RepID=UPI000AC63DD5|nr:MULTISPECIES: pyrroloquinoline quinone-dependent dehydrogenase [unclassified Devosia]MBN9304359.1 pyrroloquinoline quinone-dependent dehydrogenase [Devosia sp.]
MLTHKMLPAVLATALFCSSAVAAQPGSVAADGSQAWYTFTGQLNAQKYATADQITPDNVGKLQTAWQMHTGDVSDGKDPNGPKASDWGATPLFVNDTLYVSTVFDRIFALEPDTGKTKWMFDTHVPLVDPTQGELKNRGLSYWQAETPVAGQPCQKIIYLGTMNGKVFAVDADSGQACTGFGQNGVLDINQWNTVNAKWPLSILQPPTVYKNQLFIGWSGQDWTQAVQPPGSVFAVDAQTGKLNWKFDAIPPDLDPKTGTSNVWSSMSVDEANNLVFMPVSSPSPDYYGGDRTAPMPLSTSVTALNADTGAVVWSYQIVHHDIWDYDTNSAPVLFDLQKDGKTVPALIQSSKQGFLYVLNRLTGQPIFPIDEKPVPASDVPGEQAAATQPWPTTPEATTPDQFPGISTLADVLSAGYCSRTMAGLRYEGRYTPPSLQGTLAYPATAGGVEWGGGALDPTTNTYVVNSSSVAQIYRLLKREDYDKVNAGLSIGQKNANGYFAQLGAPYGFELQTFLNPMGMPCWNGPYGTLSSYDLNTGKLNWREPFGEVQKWGFYMPESWGSVTIGSPVITKSGVIFIGASMDSRVRAIDLKSGKVLWSSTVEAPAVAEPAVYTYKGKEYVVFAVGGNSILEPKVADQLIAYALPE